METEWCRGLTGQGFSKKKSLSYDYTFKKKKKNLITRRAKPEYVSR